MISPKTEPAFPLWGEYIKNKIQGQSWICQLKKLQPFFLKGEGLTSIKRSEYEKGQGD